MAISLDGTAGITAPAIDAALDASDLTGNVAAARITTALNATGTAPVFAARAWVNFNGVGTVAIRASGNVSSITDNGTGDYTVNFTTAMPDANYSVSGTSTDPTAVALMQISPALLSSPLVAAAARVQTRATSTGALRDADLNSVAIFR